MESFSVVWRGSLRVFLLLAVLVMAGRGTGYGQCPGGELPPDYIFETEILSMDLSGGPFPLPLGPGWTAVQSGIILRESPTLASKGLACATKLDGAGTGAGDGDLFFVNSFFDVFFDVTIKDVDPDHNFFGDLPALSLSSIGPAHMENRYTVPADTSLPNWGLIPPPESAPYIGHFLIEIPLGVDINGNGENDKIKFTLATHTVNGENRTFIILPDGTVIDSFDSTASLEGAIVDESSDPPFGPITLTGPTTVSSKLVPEPSSSVLLSLGIGSLLLLRWRRRR
jgi:hypothetical protein